MGRVVNTDDIIKLCDKFLARCARELPNKYFDRSGVRHIVKLLCERTPSSLNQQKCDYNNRGINE